ncbi:hypothetical protein GX51_07190 [Blastomyces parvus]|uniref:Uncharacterized protein n=1 Tax=Blastomyces parvus TaxID=2060905 RepID=A0A2B7WMC4_9EURO|nr:hypothetical protein GX51_07190 [Blastomyces parvus]
MPGRKTSMRLIQGTMRQAASGLGGRGRLDRSGSEDPALPKGIWNLTYGVVEGFVQQSVHGTARSTRAVCPDAPSSVVSCPFPVYDLVIQLGGSSPAGRE